MGTFTPALRIEVPEGWYVKESVTVLAADGQANVISSSEPLHPDVDTAEYAHVQGDLLEQDFPGYQETSFGPASVFGGHQGYIRHFSWQPPEGVRVNQIQCYYAIDGRGYTATATTPTTEYPHRQEDLLRLLQSIRVGTPMASA